VVVTERRWHAVLAASLLLVAACGSAGGSPFAASTTAPSTTIAVDIRPHLARFCIPDRAEGFGREVARISGERGLVQRSLPSDIAGLCRFQADRPGLLLGLVPSTPQNFDERDSIDAPIELKVGPDVSAFAMHVALESVSDVVVRSERGYFGMTTNIAALVLADVVREAVIAICSS
jgi:hypothetical protein